MLCKVPAARILAGPTVQTPSSSSCSSWKAVTGSYRLSASPSVVAVPSDVVPSRLWEGSVLVRREVAHEKSVFDHW